MAFRHTLPPSPSSRNAYIQPPAYSNPAEPISTSLSGSTMPPPPDPASPSLSNKRQRLDPLADPNSQGPPIPGPGDDTFITDHDAGESGADDDDDEEKPKSDKKAGRRKIKIEFIQDKSRRHITFSKRKAGIMKKAYELSTLTGTQVLLLVVSETGLVYTFTTAKLQPLVTQPEGKNLIQACLNAPHGQLPSSMPVGTPIGRSSNMSMPGSHAGGPANVPGGLSISGGGGAGKDDGENEDGDAEQPGSATDRNPSDGGNPAGRKRRRASSTATNPNSSAAGPTTRSSANNNNNASLPPAPPPQGPTTSPHTRTSMPLPIPQSGSVAISPTQGLPSPLDHRAPPQSPNYAHAPYGGDMYSTSQGQPPQYPSAGPGGPPPPYGYVAPSHEAPQANSLAGAHGTPWGPPPSVQQGYGRR